MNIYELEEQANQYRDWCARRMTKPTGVNYVVWVDGLKAAESRYTEYCRKNFMRVYCALHAAYRFDCASRKREGASKAYNRPLRKLITELEDMK